MEQPPQDISIETPATLREVGIHLGTFSKQLDEIKATEKQHHADNQAANAAIIKRLDDLKEGTPTHEDFTDHETRIRRLENWGAIAVGGLYVINTLIALYVAFKH